MDDIPSQSLADTQDETSPQESPVASLIRWERTLLELTKLRLVALVVVTTAVGFVMASGTHHDVGRLLFTLVGTALTAAGSMALNELAEEENDARMHRTRHRPLPAGEMTRAQVLGFGLTTATAGIVLLAWRVNVLTAALAALVVVLYTLVYTPLKRTTTLCTLAGAVCGAIPPMMGWTGAAGKLAAGAWLLALILFLWQIPHFLSLAWLYREDYARGGFVVLPVVDREGRATTVMVILYILALLPVGVGVVVAGLAGPLFAVGSVVFGGALLALGIALARSRSRVHARRLFLATLLYLPLLLGLMVLDRTRPAVAEDTAAVSTLVAPAQTVP